MRLTSSYFIIRVAEKDPAFAAYWISPQGEVIDVGLTHAAWAVQNIPELENRYPRGWMAGRVVDDALKLGWVRIRGDAIHVLDWDDHTSVLAKSFVRKNPKNFQKGVIIKIGPKELDLTLHEFLAM